jgi:hypothetical protein
MTTSDASAIDKIRVTSHQLALAAGSSLVPGGAFVEAAMTNAKLQSRLANK